MNPSDREAISAVRKMAVHNLPDSVWADMEKQVQEGGLNGLRGTARVIFDSIVLASVLKHGSHNQKSHAGTGGGSKIERGRSLMQPGDKVVVSTNAGKKAATYVGKNPDGSHMVTMGGKVKRIKNDDIAAQHHGELLHDKTPKSLTETLYKEVGEED